MSCTLGHSESTLTFPPSLNSLIHDLNNLYHQQARQVFLGDVSIVFQLMKNFKTNLQDLVFLSLQRYFFRGEPRRALENS